MKRTQCCSLQELTHFSGLEILNKQYLTSSKPCRCIFYPGNLQFQQETHFPGNDVDEGVSIQRTHLVTKAQYNTLDRDPHITTDRASSGQFLFISPPFITLENFSFLYHMSLYLSGYRSRSTDLIVRHLNLTNPSIILSRGIPEKMVALGWTLFLK